MTENLRTENAGGRTIPVAHARVKETPRHEVPPQVLRLFEEHLRKAEETKRIYGEGVAPVTANNGEFVAVGNTIYKSSRWKTFHEFLVFHGLKLFGSDWMKAEIEKAPTQRHPMAQWFLDIEAFRQSTFRPDSSGEFAPMTGPVLAYMRTSYDLYVLAHNNVLQEQLLARLRNPVLFQGARYETYVAAGMIKAGFNITLEDETDISTSHCEFKAVHKSTGSEYSVEAKSRHRSGYLGQPGIRMPVSDITAQVTVLLEKALQKRAEHQRIVFVDINVPHESNHVFRTDWFRRIAEQVNVLERNQTKGKEYPAAFLIFSNHGEHYLGDNQPAPGPDVVFTAINMPEFTLINPHVLSRHPALNSLVNSLSTHTHIPKDFS